MILYSIVFEEREREWLVVLTKKKEVSGNLAEVVVCLCVCTWRMTLMVVKVMKKKMMMMITSEAESRVVVVEEEEEIYNKSIGSVCIEHNRWLEWEAQRLCDKERWMVVCWGHWKNDELSRGALSNLMMTEQKLTMWQTLKHSTSVSNTQLKPQFLVCVCGDSSVDHLHECVIRTVQFILGACVCLDHQVGIRLVEKAKRTVIRAGEIGAGVVSCTESFYRRLLQCVEVGTKTGQK